eukprot:3804095-Rhodomonas_salina.1
MDRWSAAKTERCVYFCALAHGVVIDASTFGSWARFVNHHCEAVAALTQVSVKGERQVVVELKQP